MTRIFISYSYQDAVANQFARFLHDHMRSMGPEPIDVFDTIEPGEDWQAGITEAINKCAIFICFVKKDNPNVMFELGYALAKNKKIILIGDVEDLPADVRSMIYIPKDAHPFEVLRHVDRYLRERAAHPETYTVSMERPQETIRILLDRPELLDTIGPREFEELVMRWFQSKGLHVTMTTASRDYGFDMLVEPFRGERAIIEVKKYKTTSQVPLAVIRELVGAMTLERIPVGIIIATAPFTRSSHFFVREIQPRVLLWTLNDLAQMDEMPNKIVDTYVSPYEDAS